jgi:hypothetical protein
MAMSSTRGRRSLTLLVHLVLIAPFVLADVVFVVGVVAALLASGGEGFNILFIFAGGFEPLFVLLAVVPFAWLLRRWWRGDGVAWVLLGVVDAALALVAVALAGVGQDVWGPRRTALVAGYASLAVLAIALLIAEQRTRRVRPWLFAQTRDTAEASDTSA